MILLRFTLAAASRFGMCRFLSQIHNVRVLGTLKFYETRRGTQNRIVYEPLLLLPANRVENMPCAV